jgi:murein DD-endopeptidase MepM/ murein hydrolase activator NlpD
LLKPEITQKDKSVSSLKTHQNVTVQSVTIPGQPSGLAKLASLSVNHRSRVSALMAGLVLSMGVSSFPVNCADTAATAAESATQSLTTNPNRLEVGSAKADNYVQQLRSDVSAMRSQYGHQSSILVAQIEPGRAYPSVANRTEINNFPTGGEQSVQISVPAPKTKTFKAVATASPVYNPNSGETEGDLNHPGDRSPGRAIETNLAFQWPAAGKLTSRFGRRWGRMHKGIDIAGPSGTPIHAAADGIVVSAGWSSGGYGNLVEIKHADGTTTRYGHNSRLSVSVGQTIHQGQQVAEMGSTGHSTGSHLHFEIRPGGADAVNPIAHLPSNV